MASYIPNITDYIPQIQPFSPDYNFLGNVLQTKQSQYDKNYHEVNRAYSSLLNSPLSRDNNIKRRDEFFKTIDSDIKRISGLDLSRQENVDAANKVFKGFYEDKFLVNDMVKTKQYYNELQRGDNFKGCLDVEKCGGQYWEEGIKELHYRNDEFKKMSDDESLNYNPGSFTPYYNWQKDALKTAKDAGLDVKYDQVTSQWIIHNRNGELVQGGLYSLFKSVHGDDPRVNANYKTKSYVQRKDFIAQNAEFFGGEDKAEKAYIDKHLQSSIDTVHKTLETQTKDFENVNSHIAYLEHKFKTKGPTAKEKEDYTASIEKRDQLKTNRDTLQSNMDELVTNINGADITSLRGRVDKGVANVMEDHDMVTMAHTISQHDKEQTVRANPYGEIWARAAVEKQMKLLQHSLDLDKLKNEYGWKMTLEDYKNGVKANQIPFSLGETLEAVPGSDVQVNTEDNPGGAYERNRALAIKDMPSANSASSDMTYNLFVAAKNAFKDTKSAGAKQWLDITFGKDWNKVTDKDAFNALVQTGSHQAINIFRSALETLDPSKNPTSDNSWAQETFNKNRVRIQDLKDFDDATLAKVSYHMDANRRVAANMVKHATAENMFLKDADLLVPNGFLSQAINAPDSFVKQYQQRHPGVSPGDANDMYHELKKNFFYEYNKTKDTSMDQGVGLTGSGMVSSNGTKYTALDPANADANHFGIEGHVLKDLSTILNTTGAYVITTGGIDSDNYKKGSTIPDSFIKQFLTDAVNANYKTKDRPIFDAERHPVAANSSNISAMKIRLSPEYIKNFKGTKDDQDILYKRSAELQDGVTVFYDNTRVPNTFADKTQAPAVETILRRKSHYSIDAFKGTSGTVDFNYDHASNTVTVIPHFKGYKDGVYQDIPQSSWDIPMSSIETTRASVLQGLEQLHDRILKGQDIEAYNNKNN